MYIDTILNGNRESIVELFPELDQIFNDGISFNNRYDDNRLLRLKLRKFHYHPFKLSINSHNYLIDFVNKKKKVGIEIQFRQDTNVLYDLAKLYLLNKLNVINLAVCVTMDRDCMPYGYDKIGGQQACYQRVITQLSDFMGFYDIKYPLWIVGIQKTSSHCVT